MGLSNESRQGEGEENGEDERTSERRQMQTRKETETEKSEWARAKKAMKTKLEVDEVDCKRSLRPSARTRSGREQGQIWVL